MKTNLISSGSSFEVDTKNMPQSARPDQLTTKFEPISLNSQDASVSISSSFDGQTSSKL